MRKRFWIIDKKIANSAGNLCLHLVGNLKTYIGAELGGSGYIRNRELEFSAKDIPREELMAAIDETLKVVSTTLKTLTEADLKKQFPVLVWDSPTPVEFFLIHLATHLTYHLGQVNYHRRLLDGQD